MRNTTSNGVGSHILDMRYSGFYNLAGVAGFNPLTLNPSLWLDSSKTSAMILDGTDTVALLDKSEGLSQTNTYTSNFSAGTDSWNVVGGALSANEDSITDDFGTSKDDCLEITIGGVSNKQINRASTITDGKTYKITGSVYFPTANTKANSLVSRGTVDLGYQTTDGTKGIWTNFEFTTTMEGLGSIYYFYFYNDGNGIYTGTGDLVYLNNVKMDEIAGNHMIQGTSANRPVADSATTPTRTTFTAANSEFVENTLDVATFTAMSQGSVAYVNGGAGIGQFTLADDSVSNKYFAFGTSSNKAYMTLNVGGTASIFVSTSAISINDIVQWTSTGAAYKCHINGVEDTVSVTVGANDGAWLDSVTGVDSVNVGSIQRASPLYYGTEHKQTFVFGTALTDEESLSLAVYMMSQIVAFNPLQLSPSLWLDSLGSDASILDGSDVVASLDKSEGLTETNVYTSNFSAGVDGWSAGNVTIEGGVDSVTDDFGTVKNDCLKATCIPALGATVRNTSKAALLTVGKSYNYKAWVLVPSGQPTVDGFSFYTGAFLDGNSFPNINGVWTYVDFNFTAGFNALIFYGKDGTSNSPNAGLDDSFYTTEAEINEIDGNHFVQTVSANRPLSDDPDYMTQTEFLAANSEFLENTLDVATFAAMSQGSVFYVSDGNVSEVQFSLSRTDSNSGWIRFGIRSGGQAVLQLNAGSTTMRSTISPSVGDIVEWKSTGSVYKVFINGIEDTVVIIAGANNGDWLDASIVSLNELSIGSTQSLTPLYRDTVSRQLFVFGTPLTDYESLVQATYMIEQSRQGAAVRAGSEVIAKLTGTLADGEEAKIRATVEEMYLSGNWDKMDYFFGWFLEDEANALISWKGTKTATNVNSSPHNTEGFTFNGSTQYVDTGIVPSTDGTNAVLDDTHMEGYMYNNLSVATNVRMYGARSGSEFLNTYQDGTASIGIASSSPASILPSSGGFYTDKTRYGVHRSDSANQSLYVDGLLEGTGAKASVALVTNPIFIGAYNGNGSAASHLKSTQSYLVYGGGFDLTALNTELTNAEARFSLDNEAQQVINKFPNPLTATEDAKIRSFVNGMVADGNWDKLDYFYGWFLSDEDNALTSWKGIKTATNVNSTVHGVTGFTTNSSTQYINTNITPSTDGTNAVLDDIHVEAYMYSNDTMDTGAHYNFGVNDGSFLAMAQLLGKITMFVNNSSTTDYLAEPGFSNRSRYGIGRVDSANQEIFKDGVQVATGSKASVSLPASPIYMGSRNATGTPSNGIQATQSYFLYGGGFNLTALNTRLNALQTSFNLN